jgi:hypothetical protein
MKMKLESMLKKMSKKAMKNAAITAGALSLSALLFSNANADLSWEEARRQIELDKAMEAKKSELSITAGYQWINPTEWNDKIKAVGCGDGFSNVPSFGLSYSVPFEDFFRFGIDASVNWQSKDALWNDNGKIEKYGENSLTNIAIEPYVEGRIKLSDRIMLNIGAGYGGNIAIMGSSNQEQNTKETCTVLGVRAHAGLQYIFGEKRKFFTELKGIYRSMQKTPGILDVSGPSVQLETGMRFNLSDF